MNKSRKNLTFLVVLAVLTLTIPTFASAFEWTP